MFRSLMAGSQPFQNIAFSFKTICHSIQSRDVMGPFRIPFRSPALSGEERAGERDRGGRSRGGTEPSSPTIAAECRGAPPPPPRQRSCCVAQDQRRFGSPLLPLVRPSSATMTEAQFSTCVVLRQHEIIEGRPPQKRARWPRPQ